MSERIVVIGGDAAGMSAAHQALRTARDHGRDVEVVALERGDHTSYSACGIPYWIAGDVAEGDELVARAPEAHREQGVDLRTGATAIRVDADARVVEYVDRDGREQRLGYDQLVVATGAHPIVPDWARDGEGAPYDGVGVVKTLPDGEAWISRFAAVSTDGPRRVVVAGGGFIGVEMAEAALRRGFEVTVLTRSRVLSDLDPEVSARVVAAMEEAGVRVVEQESVVGIDTEEGRVTGVRAESGHHPCDLLVLALGVRPATELLRDVVPLGTFGGFLPDPTGLVAPRIWAAGDCCEVVLRLTGERLFLPLGTHANKMGRAVGDNLGGGSLRFDGALGTAITRFACGDVELEIARTGLNSNEAQEAGLDVVAVTTEGTTASGYMPEAEPIAIRMLGERGTRRLLGAQVVGGTGAGKRIDVVAMALWSDATVDDLAWADLSYAPPFATAWEIISLAARRLAERL